MRICLIRSVVISEKRERNLLLGARARALVLLRYFSAMRSPWRSCLAAWQIGQRGSQRAMAQAKARRIVTRESWKWRSGRDADRIVGFLSESGARGGKMPFSPPSEQGEASERAGDMVVPAAKAPAFKVVEPELVLEVLVDPLGVPAVPEELDEV